MKWLAISLMYIGYFSAIGYAVFLTHSAMPLWALLLFPSVDDVCCKCKCDKEKL